MKIHIVQKGDTLWKIAKKYGVNFEELKKMNSQLSNPDMIMPGMKVKIPSSGGNIKKEAPMGTKPDAIHLGAKKEMPLHEHPFAKEKPIAMPIKEAPIKEVPIKEMPIKEAPIVKEVPKAPYTPKMPLQIIPEIDINNYYTMNMQSMTIEQPPLPPKPANILPEVKEVPKKEVPVVEAPIETPPPPPPAPVQMEQPDYCVPVTPVMPGAGFCPPFEPMIPCQPMQGVPYPANPGYMPTAPAYMPHSTGYSAVPPVSGMAPTVAGTSFVPPHEESSSFMPQMPMTNPGYNPGGVMGVQNPYMPHTMPNYVDPAAQYPASGYPMSTGYPGAVPPAEYPAGFQHGVPAGYPGEYPGGYPGGIPTGYPGEYPGSYPAGAPTGYPGEYPGGYPAGALGGYPGGVPTGYPAGVPGGYPAGVPSGYPGEYPAGYQAGPAVSGAGYMNPTMAPPYGQYPYGYPQMGGTAPGGMGVTEYNYPEFSAGGYMPHLQETVPAQSLPVGTGALGDCGCGGPVQPLAAAPEQGFVPPTPPIYSAPFTSPANTMQPPLMNPYGMGSIGVHPYGMPRYQEESNENGN